tara:strand:- start:7473 stop:8555 length:1083 start_codon:yes stop_codon:yes gene_type:complete
MTQHSDEIIKKIKKNKIYLNKKSKYNENPKMCAVLLSFNHEYNVEALYEKLSNSSFDEVIICEDGSIDGSMEKWVDLIEHKNHYILRSNDIHELRAYEKAIHMSEAKIICLLQDDDVLPDDDEWLKTANFLFKKYPKLAILGGARGRDISFKETYGLNSRNIPFTEPEIGEDFMFIENINIGPYFIRKDVFLKLGGWDHRCSAAGEPGILFESEICYRAWLEGYQVGLVDIPVKLDDEDRGTVTFDTTVDPKAPEGKRGIRQINYEKNTRLMRALYGPYKFKSDDPRRAGGIGRGNYKVWEENHEEIKEKYEEIKRKICSLNKTLKKKNIKKRQPSGIPLEVLQLPGHAAMGMVKRLKKD